MKTLREAISDYLIMRRGLGFKLYHVERDLGSFVSFLEREKAPHIYHDRFGTEVGPAALRCATRLLGSAAQLRARVRTALERH